MTDDIARWQAFASRVTLTFPFRVDVVVSQRASRVGPDRTHMRVVLHVLERDTREPITVDSGRPCATWTSDGDAVEMLFDLLDVALRHEAHESVRLDGALVRELHKRTVP